MIAMFLVFFGPIFLAMFLYRNLDLWSQAAPSNYGELMMPIQPLSVFNVTDSRTNEPLSVESLEQHWTLILVAQKGCDLSCEASLFKVRQMRFLLGRELQRVQYLYLALDQASANAGSELAELHPRMVRVFVSPETAAQQSMAFGDDPVGNLYLVDPNGNLVLRYTNEAEVDGMLKDLKQLLKVSKIG